MRHEVVLYERAGCSLCDYARVAIVAASKRRDFTFRRVDIGSEGEVYEEYKYDIPVVEIDGRRAFRHRVDLDRLLEKLA